MPHIQWIDDGQATGEVAEIYHEYSQRRPERPGMPGILKCFSQRPDLLRRVIQISDELHFAEGHLTRQMKEMIATLVSALNQCPY